MQKMWAVYLLLRGRYTMITMVANRMWYSGGRKYDCSIARGALIDYWILSERTVWRTNSPRYTQIRGPIIVCTLFIGRVRVHVHVCCTYVSDVLTATHAQMQHLSFTNHFHCRTALCPPAHTHTCTHNCTCSRSDVITKQFPFVRCAL